LGVWDLRALLVRAGLVSAVCALARGQAMHNKAAEAISQPKRGCLFMWFSL
jgi:hypothetical protein